jgi:hypothetical protein
MEANFVLLKNGPQGATATFSVPPDDDNETAASSGGAEVKGMD